MTGNRFGPNNLAGDPDTGVMKSTGVMLLSAFVKTTIVVADNKLAATLSSAAAESRVSTASPTRNRSGVSGDMSAIRT